MIAAQSARQRILDEVRRTAEANGGVPLGTARFLRETGIKITDWEGRFWARWGDALKEAGFEPNEFTPAFETSMLIEKFVSLIRELGKFPTGRELKLKRQADSTFPSAKSFARLGVQQQLAAKIEGYCEGREELKDVIALCKPISSRLTEVQQYPSSENPSENDFAPDTKPGYVYMALLKLGRDKRYKIGKAVLVEHRADQLSLQMPEKLELVHAINTDDAYGIESYWHRRFLTKNTNGEWFSLSRQDVDAFKRRKFM